MEVMPVIGQYDQISNYRKKKNGWIDPLLFGSIKFGVFECED
jgi:hypothetical protein